jgi:hypothetical protein
MTDASALDAPVQRHGSRGSIAVFVSGSTVSVLGDAVGRVVIPLLLYKLTNSSVSLGIAIALTYLPYAMFGLIAGTLVDRVDRWRLLIVGEVMQCLILAALAALQWSDALTSLHLYAAVFLITLLSIPATAASAAALPSLVPSDRLLQSNKWLTGGQSVAEAAGPALAVLLLADGGEGMTLAISAAIFASSSVLLLLASRRSDATSSAASNSAATSAGSVWGDIKLGLAYIWRSPLLRAISLLAIAVNVFAPTVNAQFVVYATDVLRLPESASGLLISVGAIGAIATLPLIGVARRWLDYSHLLSLGYAIQGVAAIALAFTHQPWLGLVLWAVFSGTTTIQRTLTLTLRQHIVDPALMGRVFATSMTVAWAVIPLGVLAGGFATEAIGATGVFTIVGIGIIVTIAVFHRVAADRVRASASENGL